MSTREQMIEELQERTCRVIFKKVNGEERDMLCTLNMDSIPEEKRPANPGTKYNEAVIRAFDVDMQEFRSFRVDNIVSFT